jgi:hypothetical protein
MPSPTTRVQVPASLIARRAAALREYNDLHASDGVTPTAWLACARELAEVAAEIAALPGTTSDDVLFVADRARDAGHEAVACARRLEQAVSRWTGIQATEGLKAVCS